MKYVLLLLLILYPTFSEEAMMKSKPIETIDKTFEIKYGKIDAIDEELICLALNIYWESRSLPTKSQALVGQVTLNRVDSSKFPNTICGVVKKPSNNKALPRRCAWSWFCDGKSDIPREHLAWDKAVQIAHRALQGEYKHLTKADHYTSCDVKISWQESMTFEQSDNHHCFFIS